MYLEVFKEALLCGLYNFSSFFDHFCLPFRGDVIIFHFDFGAKRKEFDSVAHEIVISLPKLDDLCDLEVLIGLALDVVGIKFVLESHHF